MISHEIISLYCPQAGLCGFHRHLYNAHGCFWSLGCSTRAGLQPHWRLQHTHHAQLAQGSHPGDEPRDKEKNPPQTSAPPHLQCRVQGQVQHLPLKCAPDESSLSGTVTPLFHRQFYQEDQNKKKSFKSLKQ